ncbi:MAG: ABC transporter permease [Candidatus Zixiibacteriota bacterium]
MKSFETLRIAIDSLLRNKTRALLTMLGIIIGVAAVVAMMALGKGAKVAIETQITSLGTNILMVRPNFTVMGGVNSGAGAAQSLTLDDIQAIRDQCPSIQYISPTTRTNRQVVAGSLNWQTQIQGGIPEFLKIRDWTLAEGEMYSDADDRSATKVCVIGKTVADELFPDGGAVGQMIRIGKMPFKVLGTLTPKGQNAMGQDQDDFILAPFSTVQKKIQGVDFVGQIIVSAASKEAIPVAQQQMKDLLRIRHKLQDWQDDDFTIMTQTDIAQTLSSTANTMTALLASVAGVSLVVGGIGIMNIMLVSVQERTREIGLRMSIGARRKDILLQFLIESILLSMVGGFLGIALGFEATNLITRFTGWAVLVSGSSVGMAFAFAACVGMFFGYYPARKAARLSPIEALRYE